VDSPGIFPLEEGYDGLSDPPHLYFWEDWSGFGWHSRDDRSYLPLNDGGIRSCGNINFIWPRGMDLPLLSSSSQLPWPPGEGEEMQSVPYRLGEAIPRKGEAGSRGQFKRKLPQLDFIIVGSAKN